MNHWSEFLKARARAIHGFFAEGQTYTEIVHTLNLQDITHALAIHAGPPARLAPHRHSAARREAHSRALQAQ